RDHRTADRSLRPGPAVPDRRDFPDPPRYPWTHRHTGAAARTAPAPGGLGPRLGRAYFPRRDLQEGRAPAGGLAKRGGDRGVLRSGVFGAGRFVLLSDDRIPDFDFADGFQDLCGGGVFLCEDDHQLADDLDGRQIVVVVLPGFLALDASIAHLIVVLELRV